MPIVTSWCLRVTAAGSAGSAATAGARSRADFGTGIRNGESERFQPMRASAFETLRRVARSEHARAAGRVGCRLSGIRTPVSWRKPASAPFSMPRERRSRDRKPGILIDRAPRFLNRASLTFFERWSGREDLNLRPFGPEPNALPSCATPRERGGEDRAPARVRQPRDRGCGSSATRGPTCRGRRTRRRSARRSCA
jgi:hypothetical protein